MAICIIKNINLKIKNRKCKNRKFEKFKISLARRVLSTPPPLCLSEGGAQVYIKVSFGLSFSPGNTSNLQIDHGAKYYSEGAFSVCVFREKKERKETKNKIKIEKI